MVTGTYNVLIDKAVTGKSDIHPKEEFRHKQL